MILVEQFLGCRAELRGGGLLRPRDGFDQRIAIKGIDLVEHDDRHHQAIAHFRRSDGTAQTDDDIDVVGGGRGRMASTNRSISAGSRGTSR